MTERAPCRLRRGGAHRDSDSESRAVGRARLGIPIRAVPAVLSATASQAVTTSREPSRLMGSEINRS